MPRVIDCHDETPCELGECIEALESEGFRAYEEDSLLHAASWLRKLGNNRHFLGDMMLEELKQGADVVDEASSYGPQVVMLSGLGREYYMRANFWPSADEHMFRASGSGAFSYELPHDHNFDFLTVGYFGPGYTSDYYEYDYESRRRCNWRKGRFAVYRTLHARSRQTDALPCASRCAFAIAAGKPVCVHQHHACRRCARVAGPVPL